MTTHPLFAGIGGHQSPRAKTDDWLTPPHVIEALGGWQSFDLDPCTTDAPPWPTAQRGYGRRDNGLMLPWFGRVWLNPPYSTGPLRQFMGRMVAHGRGVALIFARTETSAFAEFVWGAASAVLFIRGRLCFHRPDGSQALTAAGMPANAGGPSVLCAYGHADADVLAGCGIEGHFVPLHVSRFILAAVVDQTWLEAISEWFGGRTGPVALADVYRAFASHPKARSNRNVQAKIRQVLQRSSFRRLGRGVWAGLASADWEAS